jgi:hypothetical protein
LSEAGLGLFRRNDDHDVGVADAGQLQVAGSAANRNLTLLCASARPAASEKATGLRNLPSWTTSIQPPADSVTL